MGNILIISKKKFNFETYLVVSKYIYKSNTLAMSDTKTEIIRIATSLVLEKGFNAFSYADISKALNIKNAAVHYHFPSKDDLGIAIMKAQQEGLKGLIQGLRNRQASEVEQINVLFDIYVGLFGQKQICALGAMGSDIQTLSPDIQIEVKKDYEQVIDWLMEILDKGREKGLFKFEGESSIKAVIIMNNLISGVIVARFNSFEKSHFRKILNQVLAEIM